MTIQSSSSTRKSRKPKIPAKLRDRERKRNKLIRDIARTAGPAACLLLSSDAFSREECQILLNGDLRKAKGIARKLKKRAIELNKEAYWETLKHMRYVPPVEESSGSDTSSEEPNAPHNSAAALDRDDDRLSKESLPPAMEPLGGSDVLPDTDVP